MNADLAQLLERFPRARIAAIGDLVADSLWKSDVLFGMPATVDIAFVNGGGIRAARERDLRPHEVGADGRLGVGHVSVAQ